MLTIEVVSQWWYCLMRITVARQQTLLKDELVGVILFIVKSVHSCTVVIHWRVSSQWVNIVIPSCDYTHSSMTECFYTPISIALCLLSWFVFHRACIHLLKSQRCNESSNALTYECVLLSIPNICSLAVLRTPPTNNPMRYSKIVTITLIAARTNILFLNKSQTLFYCTITVSEVSSIR